MRANPAAKQPRRASGSAQLNSRKPVTLHNIEIETVMPKTIGLRGAPLLRAASRTNRRVPARMALGRRSRSQTNAIRTSRRASKRINQPQRQNRRYQSRPQCAAESHKTHYSTASRAPEAAHVAQVPIPSYALDSFADPRSPINDQLQSLYNSPVERNPVPWKSSRPARSLLQDYASSKTLGS